MQKKDLLRLLLAWVVIIFLGISILSLPGALSTLYIQNQFEVYNNQCRMIEVGLIQLGTQASPSYTPRLAEACMTVLLYNKPVAYVLYFFGAYLLAIILGGLIGTPIVLSYISQHTSN
jgi:hypothetical protein